VKTSMKEECLKKCGEPEGGVCFVYCVYESFGIFNDNRIVKETLKNAWTIEIVDEKDGFLPPEWEAVVEKSFDKCSEGGKAARIAQLLCHVSCYSIHS